MGLTPGQIKWRVLDAAQKCLTPIRRMNGAVYEASRDALQQFLCAYFDSDTDCIHGIDGSVACIGANGSRKHLKVRWALPGGGKRGGLRLAVAVDCAAQQVWIAGAWERKSDPDDADFERALNDVPSE